jgi:hypothetical protein
MAPDPGHRASDADREAVSGVIRDAAADGRLGIDELDERLSAVWSARTYGELALTTTDLPVDVGAILAGQSVAGPQVAVVVGRTRLDPAHEPTTETTIAVFGSAERRGSWTVPATLNAVAVFGGVELDLRDATLTARETVIHAFALFGGIEIVVGEDVELVVRGASILGGFGGTSSGVGRPGAPVVRVVGAAVFGGVEVKQRPPRHDHGQHRPHRPGPAGD